MATSPTAAIISPTGIAAPNFAAILNYLQTCYQTIFGADVYIANDSQDGQLIGVLAQAISDCNAATIAAYNAFSPATAQGAGLSSVVKINGLTRLVPTFSTVTLAIGGVANSTLTNGQAADTAGNLWNLPTTVVIPAGGTVNVLATCSVAGAVAAPAGTITKIQTAILGWQTVTNAAAAALGALVESDAALRVRQALSVSLPSQGIFDGMVAALQALPGVTRVRGLENNTGSTDANGIPAHTLAFIVEGGNQLAIQSTLFLKGPPGIPTYGAITVNMISANGSTRTVNYATPTPATINIAIAVHKLSGWSDATLPLIQNAVSAYIASLGIGSNISYTNLILPAYLTDPKIAGTYNITALTLQKNSGAVVSADIQLAYNEAPVSAPANVVITAT